MNYIFKGNLCGYICEDCTDYLSNVTVKLYHTSDDQDDLQFATADPKNTFSILKKKQIKSKKSRLIAETTTDESGNFQFELGEKQGYEGGVFEIDVYIDAIAGQRDRGKDPVQFTITVLQPQWRETNEGFVWAWEYCLPRRWWCFIREFLGIWVICGQVTLCDTQGPVSGVRVQAFDRDWLQDDPLGSGITDSNGHFRINYPVSAFKQGTFIDVELFGGPDLYFRVETALGAPLLIEPPARGRASDRQNVGSCFCVSLCLEDGQIPDEEETALPFFSHLGTYNYDFDIDSDPGGSGLTNGSNRAFFGSVRLNGIITKTFNGSPLEYRFEVQERDSLGNDIGAPWMRVGAGQIAKTVIGNLQRANPNYPATDPNPIETLDYVIGTPGANELAATILSDASGDWIQVPQENDGALSAAGTFIPNGNMIRLMTPTLTTFRSVDLVNPTTLVAGDSSTSTGESLVTNKHFAIRMMVREKGMSGPGLQYGLCEHVAIENARYTTLNHPDWMPVTRNNALAVAMIDVQELIDNGGCSGISSALNVLFTAAHPNLGTVNIEMSGPGGPYAFSLPAAAPGGDHFGTATLAVDPDDLDPCAYIITLSVQLLLTNGDASPDNLIDQIAFCKI